jgi:hypothetical protein
MSLGRLRLISLLVTGFALSVASSATASTPAGSKNPFCSRLGHTIEASAGAQMFCFGSQASGPAPLAARPAGRAAATPFTTNVRRGDAD